MQKALATSTLQGLGPVAKVVLQVRGSRASVRAIWKGGNRKGGGGGIAGCLHALGTSFRAMEPEIRYVLGFGPLCQIREKKAVFWDNNAHSMAPLFAICVNNGSFQAR